MSEIVALDATWIAGKAREVGFDLCGVAPAEELAAPEHLTDWLARGFAGEMRYLHDPRRGDLASVVPEARSVIVCALNYDQVVPYSIHARATFDAGDRPRGWISRYAWGDDYHEVLGEKLELLVAALREKYGAEFAARAYVDTGPISERAAAKVAGIGWLGKNTCLINKDIGSWLFLGVIITSLVIGGDPVASTEEKATADPSSATRTRDDRQAYVGQGQNADSTGDVGGSWNGADRATADPSSAARTRDDSLIKLNKDRTAKASFDASAWDGAMRPRDDTQNKNGPGKGPRQIDLAPDLCGGCTLCLEACPTGALVEPYVMDARRCISYLTIELRGSIPEEFRSAIGWQVFGCDICQDVCPWNRDGTAPEQNVEHAFAPRDGLVAPELAWLLAMSEVDFRDAFRGSPVKRTKWRGLVRNACVAAGNALRKQRAPAATRDSTQEDSALRARLAELAASDDAVIAEHARWALAQ